MRQYRYLYFTILSIYKRFSRDYQIYIFAIGLFSVIISFGILAAISLFRYYILDLANIELTWILGIMGTTLLFNALYFGLNNSRQERYERQFINNRNRLKSLLSVIILILMFFSMIWIGNLLRKENLKNTRIINTSIIK